MRKDSKTRGIYKRRRHDGEFWAYRFQWGGRSYSATTDFAATQKNLAAVKDELEAHLREVKGWRCRVPEVVRFDQAVERFLRWSELEHRAHPNTAKRQETSLASAKVFFGNVALHGIRAGDVEAYKVARFETGVADVTVRKDLHALSQLFQFGVKNDWLDRNPVRDVKIPSDRDSFNERTIDAHEEALYFGEAAKQNPVLHDVGRLMLWQGLRPGEVLALTKDDVDIEGRLLLVQRGKSRAARRELRLVPNTAGLLTPRLASPYEHIFPGGRQTYNGCPYSYSGLVNAHNAVFEELNREQRVIEPFDIYSLRHTFATRFYEATKDLDKLARILGHGSLATVRRYVNPTNDDIHRAMEFFSEKALAQKLGVPAEADEIERNTTVH